MNSGILDAHNLAHRMAEGLTRASLQEYSRERSSAVSENIKAANQLYETSLDQRPVHRQAPLRRRGEARLAAPRERLAGGRPGRAAPASSAAHPHGAPRTRVPAAHRDRLRGPAPAAETPPASRLAQGRRSQLVARVPAETRRQPRLAALQVLAVSGRPQRFLCGERLGLPRKLPAGGQRCSDRVTLREPLHQQTQTPAAAGRLALGPRFSEPHDPQRRLPRGAQDSRARVAGLH